MCENSFAASKGKHRLPALNNRPYKDDPNSALEPCSSILPLCSTRNATTFYLQPARLESIKSSVFYVGTSLWGILPLQIKEAQSLATLEILVENHYRNLLLTVDTQAVPSALQSTKQAWCLMHPSRYLFMCLLMCL